MKKLWLVIQIEENGKWYAFTAPCNVQSIEFAAKSFKSVKKIDVYSTKKEAYKCAEILNANYMDAKKYMFDEPLF